MRTVADWPAGLPGYCHEDYEPHALCVPRQWYEDALAEVERLRAALQSVLSIDDDYPLDPSGYDPDEYQRLRGIIDAARAALAERGGDGV